MDIKPSLEEVKMEEVTVDLREAMNAISDVVQNRPRPLREFDQIYMKAGDMVLQSEFVAKLAAGKRLAFIGDGDSISVCVAYLNARGIIGYGPRQVTVFDFDERIVSAINRFADQEGIRSLDAQLYNCIEAIPPGLERFDVFYTNPPWGQYNEGKSVNLFIQRGMELIHHAGEGLVVIADDDELAWPKQVLANVQAFALDRRFFVTRMMPQLHAYHLDDAASLRSCNLLLKSVESEARPPDSAAVEEPEFLANFYGREQPLKVRYVRERKRIDYGKASDEEYYLDYIDL